MSKFKFQKHNSNSGQAMLMTVIFFLLISLIVVVGSYSVAYREKKNARDITDTRKSYFLSEAGVEDLSYRIMKGKNYNSTESLSLDGFFATTTTVDINSKKEVTAQANVFNLTRKVKVLLSNN